MFGTKELRKENNYSASHSVVHPHNDQPVLHSCGGCNACHQLTSVQTQDEMTGWSGEGIEDTTLGKYCANNFFQRNLGNSYLQSLSSSQRTPIPSVNHAGVPTIKRKCNCGDSSKNCSDEKDELGKLQRKSNTGSVDDVRGESDVHAHPDQDGGRPLSLQTRQYMEPRFSIDFGHVRIHDNPDANRTALQIQARAFTYGNHIWLGAKESEEDKNLLAHELTHVAQQQKYSSSLPQTLSVSSPSDAAECEAESVAHTLAEGQSLQRPIGVTAPTSIHRILGISLPTGVRALDPAEETIGRGVYGSSLEYGDIYVSDALGAGGREFTLYVPLIGTIIQIGSSAYKAPGTHPNVIVHEMAHSWQSQHYPDPSQYMANSVVSQAAASVAGGSAYCYKPGKSFDQYATEQLAQQAENKEAPIISHMRSVSAGAVDPSLDLIVPRWETSGDPGVKCP